MQSAASRSGPRRGSTAGPASPNRPSRHPTRGRWRGSTLATAEQAPTLGGLRARRLAPPSCSQDGVHFFAVRPPDRRSIEPLDVFDVVTGDLAQGPATVATEAEYAA